MSQSVTFPVEVSSYGLLACKLPDDDVAKKVEMDLLERWDCPEHFIKASYNIQTRTQQFKNTENSPQYAETSSTVDVQAEPCTQFQNTANHVHETGEICVVMSATGNEHSVQSKRVRDLYQQAETCYMSGQTRDCLIFLDTALASDGNTDQIMLQTLKVKALNSMGKYLESLKCAAVIISEDRSKELLMEVVTSLEKLDLLFTAEEWLKKVILDKSEENNGLACTQKAFQLFQDVRSRRIYGPLIQHLPLTVSLSKYGRGLHASKIIAKGDIFSELPEFQEHSLISKIAACAHCGISLAKPEDILSQDTPVSSELKKALKRFWPKRVAIPCQICNRVVYCSESCRNDAWQSYHKVICPSSSNSASAVLYDARDSFRDVTAAAGFTWQGWWNADFSPVLMARMWAALLIQAKLRTNDSTSPTLDDWLTVLSQVEKYSSNCETSVNKSVPKMFELQKNIFKRSKVMRYEITEADFNKMYHKVSINYISFHDVNNPVHQFVEKIKNDGKLYKKIGKYFKEPLPKAEFHGMFPLTSCINHSCLPNAEIESRMVDGSPGIAVTATRDISAMEEILVSYVNPRLGRKERRDTLLRRYRFWCQCIRCMHEGDGPNRCTQCGLLAPISTVSVTRDPNKDTIEYLQRQVNTEDQNEMQIFSERFESSASAVIASASSDVNSSCRRNSLRDIADVEQGNDITTDPELESNCKAIHCCVANVKSNLHLKNGSIHKVIGIGVSTENTSNSRNEPVEEIETLTDNAIREHSQHVVGKEMSLETGSAVESRDNFPHCSRCGRAWYCSHQCQKEAWRKGHKKICGTFLI